MKISYKIVLLLFALLVVYVIIDYSNTYQHEMVHQQIYEYYNITSHIHINPIWKISKYAGYTAVNDTEYYLKCNENCKMLQMQNEIVGYNINSILSSFILLAVVIIAYFHLIKKIPTFYIDKGVIYEVK